MQSNASRMLECAHMDLNELERLLAAYKGGDLETQEAVERIKNLHFEDIGFARVDHSRATRLGFPEVVFGGGKTRAQIVAIVERLAQRSPNVIVTRTDEGAFGEIRNVVTDAEWHESARLVRIRRATAPRSSVLRETRWRISRE